jgi:hypothetical protein
MNGSFLNERKCRHREILIQNVRLDGTEKFLPPYQIVTNVSCHLILYTTLQLSPTPRYYKCPHPSALYIPGTLHHTWNSLNCEQDYHICSSDCIRTVL